MRRAHADALHLRRVASRRVASPLDRIANRVPRSCDNDAHGAIGWAPLGRICSKCKQSGTDASVAASPRARHPLPRDPPARCWIPARTAKPWWRNGRSGGGWMCTGNVSRECACVKTPVRPAAREAAFKSLLRLRRFPRVVILFLFLPFFSFSLPMRFKDFLKMMLRSRRSSKVHLCLLF